MQILCCLILPLAVVWPAVGQDMPYSLAYTFTAITLSPDGLSVTSASVANTYGSSGHTAAAVTILRSPSGRSAAANMYHDYQSIATTVLPICGNWGCEDGEWTAEGGGEEYCAIAMAYMAVAATQDRKVTPPIIMVSKVSVAPAVIPMQNGETILSIHALKSPRCPDGATLFGAVSGQPQMQLVMDPENGLVRPQWENNTATGTVKIRTRLTNTVGGTALASGSVDDAPGCEVKGTPQSKEFRVE